LLPSHLKQKKILSSPRLRYRSPFFSPYRDHSGFEKAIATCKTRPGPTRIAPLSQSRGVYIAAKNVTSTTLISTPSSQMRVRIHNPDTKALRHTSERRPLPRQAMSISAPNPSRVQEARKRRRQAAVLGIEESVQSPHRRLAVHRVRVLELEILVLMPQQVELSAVTGWNRY
jgi:hypothetical protein